MAIKKSSARNNPVSQQEKPKRRKLFSNSGNKKVKKQADKAKRVKLSAPEPELKIIELESSNSSRFKRFKEQEFEYVPDEYIDDDFLTTADLMDAVAIVTHEKGHPIRIDNKYSRYMQILEVEGQDLGALSDEEQDRVVFNFTNFLIRYPYSLTFESTTLPTNTASQYGESNRIYREIVSQMSNPNIPTRIFRQLQDRLKILQNNMNMQEEVARILYNAEFLIIIHGDTPSELDKLVRACYSAGSAGFQPRIVSDKKKKQIIKQYNNPNERV